jgi:hypothetical protein
MFVETGRLIRGLILINFANLINLPCIPLEVWVYIFTGVSIPGRSRDHSNIIND